MSKTEIKAKRPKSTSYFVFDVYQDSKRQWRWRLWARNGKIVATSESYLRQRDAIKSCDSLIDHMLGATVFVEGVQLKAEVKPAPSFIPRDTSLD